MLKFQFHISNAIIIALLIWLFVMLYFLVGVLKHQNIQLKQEIEESQQAYKEKKQ